MVRREGRERRESLQLGGGGGGGGGGEGDATRVSQLTGREGLTGAAQILTQPVAMR